MGLRAGPQPSVHSSCTSYDMDMEPIISINDADSVDSSDSGDSSNSGDSSRTQDIDIANNAELRANQLNVLNFTRASRPKNTTKTYDPKQEEFKVSYIADGESTSRPPRHLLIPPSFP